MSASSRDSLARYAPSLAVATTVLTFGLLLLGLYTAASGAGATCNNTYPGCAGQLSPVGLTVPQFVEWFHRLVAMSVGFVILANAVVLWRAYEGTRVSHAAGLALLLLPLQVVLGGTTVTFEGLVPGGYSPPVQSAHYFTALAIFTCLVAATAWLATREAALPTPDAVHRAVVAATGLLLVHLLFARNLLLTFTAPVQVAYYAFELAGFAAVLAAALWARDLRGDGPRRVRRYATVVLGLLLLEMVLGIGIVRVTPTVEAAVYVVAGLAVLVTAAAAFLPERTEHAAATLARSR